MRYATLKTKSGKRYALKEVTLLNPDNTLFGFCYEWIYTEPKTRRMESLKIPNFFRKSKPMQDQFHTAKNAVYFAKMNGYKII